MMQTFTWSIRAPILAIFGDTNMMTRDLLEVTPFLLLFGNTNRELSRGSRLLPLYPGDSLR